MHKLKLKMSVKLVDIIIIYFSAVFVVLYIWYKQNNFPLLILYIGFYIRISTDVAIGFGFMDYLLWLPITTLTIRNSQIKENLSKVGSKDKRSSLKLN